VLVLLAFCGLVAVVLSLAALREINRSARSLSGDGLVRYRGPGGTSRVGRGSHTPPWGAKRRSGARKGGRHVP
jgi:hypothetical protein